MNSFKGPLGSHKNFLVHIAFENFVDYDRLQKDHAEKKQHSTSHKYKEFRFFLNAVESFNNVLDYFYFEFEQQVSPLTFPNFKGKVHEKYPDLSALEEIANAYKHCVRSKGKNKNPDLLWAADLQKPQVNVAIDFSTQNIAVDYQFPWPIREQEEKLVAVWKFWIDYHNRPNPEQKLLDIIKAEYPIAP